MTADEDRIVQLYDVFNARAFDRFIAMLAPDVAWPDETEDGELRGREAVLAYLTETTAPLVARYTLISLSTDADEQVGVLVRQTITSAADGSLWSSTRVLHRYRLVDGLVTRLQSQQDCPDVAFPGVDALLDRLHRALNARDLEAILSCYGPTARFSDNLEGGVVESEDGLRAHFVHLLETIRLETAVMGYTIEPDDRVRARLHIVTRGPGGGLWQDDVITVWYRLLGGLIVEQDIDDSGRDGNGP